MELRDKVCVVTGGASGIGKALVERFASRGRPRADRRRRTFLCSATASA